MVACLRDREKWYKTRWSTTREIELTAVTQVVVLVQTLISQTRKFIIWVAGSTLTSPEDIVVLSLVLAKTTCRGIIFSLKIVLQTCLVMAYQIILKKIIHSLYIFHLLFCLRLRRKNGCRYVTNWKSLHINHLRQILL